MDFTGCLGEVIKVESASDQCYPVCSAILTGAVQRCRSLCVCSVLCSVWVCGVCVCSVCVLCCVVCVCVCVYVCMCVVCVSMSQYVCVCVCVSLCACLSVSVSERFSFLFCGDNFRVSVT